LVPEVARKWPAVLASSLRKLKPDRIGLANNGQLPNPVHGSFSLKKKPNPSLFRGIQLLEGEREAEKEVGTPPSKSPQAEELGTTATPPAKGCQADRKGDGWLDEQLEEPGIIRKKCESTYFCPD
jgi:hypothetical protein